MAVRKRGLTFLICFRKRRIPRKGGGGGSFRKGGVPTLEETMAILSPMVPKKTFNFYKMNTKDEVIVKYG